MLTGTGRGLTFVSMTKPVDPVTKRLITSRRTLRGWQAMGGPGGNPADLLRMITEELITLAVIAGERPEKAETIKRLAGEYEELRAEVRRRLN